MKLPLIPKKIFEVKNKFLPKGKLQFAPFSVAQEGILLQVKESEDNKEKLSAMRQVIQECLQTPNVDVGKLPIFTIEDIFLRLREQATGEMQSMAYECTAPVSSNDEEGVEVPCGNTIPVEIDLRKFALVVDPDHTNKIIISDDIGIQFKYPDMDMYDNAVDGLQDETDMIIACIDTIFQGDVVFPSNESTTEELLEFWKQLTLPQKKNVYDKFFLSMPHMHLDHEITCKKCGTAHKIEFNSVQEVFT